MKFIKDIIGEKRERVRAEAAAAPAAEPVQPPARDPFDSLAAAPEAEAGTAGAPFSLERGFQLDPEPDAADDGCILPEDFLEEDEPEEDSAETCLDSLGSEAPEEDAIAAFFAREQTQEAVAKPQPSAAAPEYAEAEDPFTAEDAEPEAYATEDYAAEEDEDAREMLGQEPDFGRLQQPEAVAEQPESYRVFHRKPAAAPQMAPQADVQPDPQPDPKADLPAEPRPDAWPEPAPQMAAPAPQPQPEAPAAAPIDVPAPSMGRGASRAGRVKTRLLGFSPAQAPGSDPFSRGGETAAPGYTQFPVGWLAVVQGPGRGAAFTLFSGVTVIGRGEDQTVRLDFGDNSISRDNHAAIAYDPEQKAFYIGHGGKANLLRRNGRPVLSTEELASGDEIRIGETTLRFVPLCGASFGWDQPQQDDSAHAAFR
ncbi:FHA domain-containing protein (plasmid) [Leisingera sp. S132]|uniref:FHA domain-containing protein n=1 Tax=Leisingera sp. S132 TaxID=2867016 RepID=UPI0021A26002|nr:FHA domain-containing protein [Leisingera sp. S132]UWQ81729.1 FHA domain-containing protein [Leisingera sp. S132]